MDYIFLFILLLISIIIIFYVKRYCYITVKPVIAGDVNRPIDNLCFKNKRLFMLNHFLYNNKIVKFDNSMDIYYLVGNSLNIFGLHDGQKVIVKRINNPYTEIKRGDFVVLVTEVEPNRGKLKGRVCLGFWGDANKGDDDLKKYENYYGTVMDYFKKESPKKYGYTNPYNGPITGYLKTLSCDQEEKRKKISRPHNPKLIVGKVEYVIDG